jgi:MOSC domain-containing protein YiiM
MILLGIIALTPSPKKGLSRGAAKVLSVQTGKVAPVGPDEVPSGIVKLPRRDRVGVTERGLEGDEIADLSVHGGPEKAVYGYAASRYPAWVAEFPEFATSFRGGAMGENLTIAGMDESHICVGDIHAIGTALLQVCQPRQPCFKFALRHDNKLLPKAMVRSGFSGWYYRVIRPGALAAGDAVILHDRPHPDFAFSRLIEIVYHGDARRDELVRMTKMQGLSRQWRVRARDQLESKDMDGQ